MTQMDACIGLATIGVFICWMTGIWMSEATTPNPWRDISPLWFTAFIKAIGG